MSKVDLTYNESKTDVNLSLESKWSDLTWEGSDPGTWGEATKTWGNPGVFPTLEAKTSASLSLESK